MLIQVNEHTAKRIKKLALVNGETYNSIINRIINTSKMAGMIEKKDEGK